MTQAAILLSTPGARYVGVISRISGFTGIWGASLFVRFSRIQLPQGVGGLQPCFFNTLLSTEGVASRLTQNSLNAGLTLTSVTSPAVKLMQDGLLRQLLVRLSTHLIGRPVSLLLMRNLQARLQAGELAFLTLQSQRIFTYMPAALVTQAQVQSYAWRFGAMALYLAVGLRDTALLIRWLQGRIRCLDLFQHRRFFRTLGVALRTAVSAPSGRYKLAGLRLQVTGKLSVTGNAMSRTYLLRAGCPSNNSLTHRLAQGFTLVRTRTGCLGVWLEFYF